MNTNNLDGESLAKRSPADKKKALVRMRHNLEEQFVELGQLLNEMKTANMHGFFGYPTFNEFVEEEFKLSGTLASKLIKNYKFYTEKMNLDESALVNLGLEKLNQLRPILNKADRLEQEKWLKRAEELKWEVLKEEIKEQKEKSKTKNIKDVYTDQFIESMLAHFNCTRKELMFKLALYFQDMDLEEVDEQINSKMSKLRQEEFNE